jgi:hypothetical protein
VYEHAYASDLSSPVVRTHLDQRDVNMAILPRGSKGPFVLLFFVFLLPVIEAAFVESVIGNSSDGCLRLGEIPE